MSTAAASWNVRHAGSPRSVSGLSLAQLIVGLRDGVWDPSDEVMGPADKNWIAMEAHPQLAEVAAEIEPPPPRYHEDETRLDMNALIDVCLVLLIFFILTTTYTMLQKVVPIPVTGDAQKGLIRKVKKGDVETFMIRVVARPGASPKEPVIKVENEAEANLKQFPDVLRSWVKRTHRHEMLLDVQGITWGTTIQIQDAAKEAGINEIHYLMKGK